jgi:hypothetical protein
LDTETTGAVNTLPEQEVPRKSGRPPSIGITSTTDLIQLQNNIKDHIKEEYKS